MSQQSTQPSQGVNTPPASAQDKPSQCNHCQSQKGSNISENSQQHKDIHGGQARSSPPVVPEPHGRGLRGPRHAWPWHDDLDEYWSRAPDYDYAIGSDNEDRREGAEASKKHDGSPDTMCEESHGEEEMDNKQDKESGEHPDPPEEAPPAFPGGPLPHRQRRWGCGRGGRGGRGVHGHHHHHEHEHDHAHAHAHHGHPRHGHGHGLGHGPRFGRRHGGPFGGYPPFMNSDLFARQASHLAQLPFVQGMYDTVERNVAAATASIHAAVAAAAAEHQGGRSTGTFADGVESFVPPIDVFATEHGWTVHAELAGVKKEDMAASWDSHAGELVLTGVVHRPGDEAFLRGLVSGERRVGLFERRVRLPPPGGETTDSDGEVDGDAIAARVEDGVLVVTVPRVEKEWTGVRKVDIA